MNNKGLSLAINQVVIIIISIVILSFGTVFLFNIFGAAEHKLSPVDDKLRNQMGESLSRGDVVEMPLSTQNIKADELAKFNLGILNDPALTGDENNFHVIINYTNAIDSDGIEIENADLSDAFLLSPKDFPDYPSKTSNKFTIEENEHKVIRIGVHPKKSSNYEGPGQYFFAACVCEGTDCDGETTCNSSTVSDIDGLYGYVTFSTIVG